MDPIWLASASFPFLLLLIFLRVPIGLSMLVVGLFGSWQVYGGSAPLLNQMKKLAYGQFSSHSLSIVPLFLLMGQFADAGRHVAGACSRRPRPSSATAAAAWRMAAIGACAGFGAICGSSLATAATMGQVALPELARRLFRRLATGALAAGGTLGILIPPSIVLVIYAILAEQNIAKLFAAAFIPGILAALGYMLVIDLVVRCKPRLAGDVPRHALARALARPGGVWPVVIDLRRRDRRHLHRLVHADRRRGRRRRGHRPARVAARRPAPARSLHGRPSRPPPAAPRWSS